jgi:uncharacterized damage-inducible protein DinB
VPSSIHRQLRHDVWATAKLLAHCRGLTDAQLDLIAPGTFGTIRRTLQHIVGADEDYLKKLGIPVVDVELSDEEDVPLDRIVAELDLVSTGVEKLFAGREPDPDRVIDDSARRNPADPPLEMDAWMMLTQFVHHGSDHRAHIGTILGAHGLATPRLDIWRYGTEIGAIREKARR